MPHADHRSGLVVLYIITYAVNIIGQAKSQKLVESKLGAVWKEWVCNSWLWNSIACSGSISIIITQEDM